MHYLLLVAVRMMMGYILFSLILAGIFIACWVTGDWSSAVAFFGRILENDFAKMIMWLPFVFSWFRPDRRGDVDRVAKENEHFWMMYDTTGGKW